MNMSVYYYVSELLCKWVSERVSVRVRECVCGSVEWPFMNVLVSVWVCEWMIVQVSVCEWIIVQVNVCEWACESVSV